MKNAKNNRFLDQACKNGTECMRYKKRGPSLANTIFVFVVLFYLTVFKHQYLNHFTRMKRNKLNKEKLSFSKVIFQSLM